MDANYPAWWKCWVCDKRLKEFGCPDPFFRFEEGYANYLCVSCWEKAQDIFDEARYAWRRQTMVMNNRRRPRRRKDVEVA